MDINNLLNNGRCIVLDTETTGMPAEDGHRITEVGAVEIIDRKITGRTFQVYLDPKREVDEGAEEVHGLSRSDLIRLSDGNEFKDIAQGFSEFVNGDPLIIHNAKFDMGFLDMEYGRIGAPTMSEQVGNKVFDSLTYANNQFPGRRNNLDALCKRFGVNNKHRDIHGALVDSFLLAEVFLLMTQVQRDIIQSNELRTDRQSAGMTMKLNHAPVSAELANRLVTVSPNAAERDNHNKIAQRIQKESGGDSFVPSF